MVLHNSFQLVFTVVVILVYKTISKAVFWLLV